MALEAAIGEGSAPYTQGGKQRPKGMVTLNSLVLCAPLLLKYPPCPEPQALGGRYLAADGQAVTVSPLFPGHPWEPKPWAPDPTLQASQLLLPLALKGGGLQLSQPQGQPRGDNSGGRCRQQRLLLRAQGFKYSGCMG